VTLTRETDPPYDRRSTTRAGRPAVGAFFPNWWSALPPFATVVEHCISTKKEEKIYRATLPCHGGKRWQRRRSLVKALAQDLDAEVEVVSGPGGVNVSLKHAALTSGYPKLPDSAQVVLRDEMAYMHIGSVLTSTERIPSVRKGQMPMELRNKKKAFAAMALVAVATPSGHGNRGL
jgi:hypothetical protein